ISMPKMMMAKHYHLAAESGYDEVVRLLIAENRTDINIKGESGQTPLHWAAESGHIEVVRFLIAKFRTDINADDDDQTLLHLAAGYGCVEVVELLTAVFRADTNAKDEYGPIWLQDIGMLRL